MMRAPLLILITFVNFACLDRDAGKRVDSETHFLTVCQFDNECADGLECLCGFCTKNCDPHVGGCGDGVCASPTVIGPTCVLLEDLPGLGGLCTESCESTSCGPGFECRSMEGQRVCGPMPTVIESPDTRDTSPDGVDSGLSETSGEETNSQDTSDPSCVHDYECTSLVCSDGTCRGPCVGDQDCADFDSGARCISGACLAGCDIGAPACPSGQVCWIWGDAAGICVPKCQNCAGACPNSLTCKPIAEVNDMLACLPPRYAGGAETPPCTGGLPRGSPCTEAQQCFDGACAEGFCGAACESDKDCNGAVCYEGHCFSRCTLCGQDDECVPGSSCRTVAAEDQSGAVDYTKLACVPYELQRLIDDLLTSQQFMCGDWCTELCAAKHCGVAAPGCSCGACPDGLACNGAFQCVAPVACGGETAFCSDAAGGDVCVGRAYFRACEGASEFRRCTACGGEFDDGSSCEPGCGALAFREDHPTQAIGQACADNSRCLDAPCDPGFDHCGEACDIQSPESCPDGTGCFIPGDIVGMCLTPCESMCDDPICPTGTRCIKGSQLPELYCAPAEWSVGKCF